MKKTPLLILTLVLSLALAITTSSALAGLFDKPTVLGFASNPSTGYEWTYVIENEKLLSITDEYVQAYSSEDVAGAGGEQEFTLKGKREGVTTVVFSYHRPFETDVAPICEITYTVETDDDDPVEIIKTFVNPGI